MRLSRLVLDFRDFVDGLDAWPELATASQDVARELGFEFLAMLHTRSLMRRSPLLIRFDNYPFGWDRHLLGRGPKIIDPVLLAVRRRASGLLWPDALARSRLSGDQRAIIDDARRHGIRQGYTVPANVPGEPEGSVSFATRSTRRIGRERQLVADALGRIAFDAARRLIGLDAAPDPVPHVSDRVRECIFWIAHGKTDQDIAAILGIGLETVRTYVKSAFRTLGVITRGQLVNEALRRGVIDFLPSTPPSG
jgi:LuxR family quorum-sensing system transcriptional regulator CciR